MNRKSVLYTRVNYLHAIFRDKFEASLSENEPQPLAAKGESHQPRLAKLTDSKDDASISSLSSGMEGLTVSRDPMSNPTPRLREAPASPGVVQAVLFLKGVCEYNHASPLQHSAPPFF